MLIYFSVENFRSINQKVELNLQPAPRLRRHKNHVVELDRKKKLRALRTAVIYGANAAGKSNLVKAIDYAQSLIVSGSKLKNRINIEQYKLAGNDNNSSDFCFEFYIASNYYVYEFNISSEIVNNEKLTKINEENFEFCLFSREYSKNSKGYIIKSDFKEYDNEIYEESFDEFLNLLKFTSNNQLFLNELISKSAFDKLHENISMFLRVVCFFFENQLEIIFPKSKYAGIMKDLSEESELIYVNALKSLDTGISDIQFREVESDHFPKDVIDDISEKLNSMNDEENSNIAIMIRFNQNDYFVTKKTSGELKISSCSSVHIDKYGSPIHFNLDEESDGTRRLLDLLPSICPPDNNSHEIINRTYIIDEFDRSLHPNLSKAFLMKFLSCDSGREKDQLIVTTHESSLLDNNLLRRDEVWFMQKEHDGSSVLYSLNDYSPRFDKDIQNDYLKGKFGATPYIMENYFKEC
jgi:uncharacterized protein